MDKRLQDAIEVVSNVMEAYTAVLFVLDEEKKKLRVAASLSLSKEFDVGTTIAPGDGIIGWVCKSAQGVNLSRFDRNTGHLCFYSQPEDIKSFMATPVGEEGVLCVDSRTKYRYVDKDAKHMMGFAKIIGHLLESGRTRRREESYAKMLSMIYGMDLATRERSDFGRYLSHALGEMQSFSRADVVFLTTFQKATQRYRVAAAIGLDGERLVGKTYNLDTGLTGWVFKNARQLNLPEVKSGGERTHVFGPGDPIRRFESFLGMPLTMWGRPVGVLGLVAHKRREWTKDERHMLAMTGRWAVAAMSTLTG